ncbi:hypothetical protein SEVIR_2G284050v4 [Setaria viridis]|uniref:Uncharacterized protein n=1 Tax=Setaria viridis TaxID=4556 RepID=A0A4U6VYF3_SETVI|nr:hypothetical protein SEVIR_2G284050v2 [Setaria viridis]
MVSPRSWPLRFVVALVLATVVVAAAASMSCVVGAAPCGDGACLAPPAMKAREAAVAMLFARLPAGSSPRGAGH